MDPGRLLRALGLTVSPESPRVWRVKGGAAEHLVRHEQGYWVCDCRDAAFRPGRPCKHRLAVYLDRQLEGAVRTALREAVGAS